MSRLFLPAGVNYIKNPHFAAGEGVGVPVSNYTGGGGNIALTWENVAGGLRAHCSGVSGDWQAMQPIGLDVLAGGPFAVGDSLTISIDATMTEKSGLAETGLQIAFWDGAWASLGAYYTNFALGAGRYSLTVVVPAGTVYYIVRPLYIVGTAEPTRSLDVTLSNFQLEKSPFPTPYFDGDSSDSLNANTYAWTGAPNASTSTRARSILGHTLPAHTASTLAIRVKPSQYKSEYLLNTGGEYYWLVGGTPSMTLDAQQVNHTSAISIEQYNSIVYRWSDVGGTRDIMKNGIAIAQAAGPAMNRGEGVYTWGGDGDLSAYYGELGPAVWSPSRKSDAWTTAMDALLRSDNVDISRIKREFMAPGDYLFTGRQIDGSKLFVKGA